MAADAGQPLLDLPHRLRAEVLDGEQVGFGAGGQVVHGVDADPPQAVVGTHGQVELLDRACGTVSGAHGCPGAGGVRPRPRAVACRHAGRWCAGQQRGQVGGEPLDDPAAHLGHDATAELGGPAGDVHGRVHDHLGLATLIRKRRADRRRGGAGAARLLSRCLQPDRP